ncbi:rhodanese-like domain-containing protein [Halobacteriales archaeon Cl-PHB]
MKLTRRTLLAAGAAGLAATAGCLGGDGGSDGTSGYPPAAESTPTERTIDTSAYETLQVKGESVPLAPIEDTYYWYQRQSARFVDSRGAEQYDRAHIPGAVLSSAPDGVQNDPVTDWPKDARIVCYCACPHHLSSLRASSLMADGYENVYVIDEGFGVWYDRGYPVNGSAVESLPEPYVVKGQASTDAAGDYAWGVHQPSDQQEAAPIASDGTWKLELRFSGLTDDSPIRVETPDYAVEHPLGVLRDGYVRADGTVQA